MRDAPEQPVLQVSAHERVEEERGEEHVEVSACPHQSLSKGEGRWETDIS